MFLALNVVCWMKTCCAALFGNGGWVVGAAATRAGVNPADSGTDAEARDEVDTSAARLELRGASEICDPRVVPLAVAAETSEAGSLPLWFARSPGATCSSAAMNSSAV